MRQALTRVRPEPANESASSLAQHTDIRRKLGDADSARLLPRFRDRAAMLAEQRAALRRAVSDAVNEGRAVRIPVMAGGDPRDLRGVPVIARGVGGTSPGTNPEAETVRRSENRAA
jgi:hypothetical protein